MKTIRDAVHGDIQITDAEQAIIDTPTFQRLRGIKQLGASNLVFPSANHTRFEHSLGTCWLTKRMLGALAQAGHTVAADDQSTAAIAGLVHDVTHVPFGHTFEDERRLMDRHDEDRQRLEWFFNQPKFGAALARTGVGERVFQLLAHQPIGAPFLRQIVAGAVSADLLDYLQRDASGCGLNLSFDDRLFHYLHLADGQLAIRLHKQGSFRRDALSELIHLLQIRYTLTERVYYHHAKVVAGAMISRALELAIDAGRFTPTELYSLRDDSLLDRLSSLRDQTPGLGDVMDDLASRRLYKRIYFLTIAGLGRPGLTEPQRDELSKQFHHNIAHRRGIERLLADRLKVPESHVIIYCPSPRMQLKEADVLVQLAPGEQQPLSALGHPDVLALENKHRGLWRFYVCLRRDHVDRQQQASEWCEELIGHPNQLGPQQSGRLTFGMRT